MYLPTLDWFLELKQIKISHRIIASNLNAVEPFDGIELQWVCRQFA